MRPQSRITNSGPHSVWNRRGGPVTNQLIVDREDFEREAASWIADAINRAVEGQGRCSIALAGGSTPRPVYWTLAQEPFKSSVKWKDTWVYFGDERAVPPDHPDNNYGAAREALLRHVAVPPSQIFRMEAERADRELAAREYEKALPDHLDLLILGMGPDGHTASLFPGSPAVDERTRKVAPVIGPKAPAARLTITPAVIASARSVLVLVTGADKAEMVVRALKGPVAPRVIPAQLAREGTWMLDRAAAAGLA